MNPLRNLSLLLLLFLTATLAAGCSGEKTYPEADHVSLCGMADSALEGRMIYLVDPAQSDTVDSARVSARRFDYGSLPAYRDRTRLMKLAATYPIGTYHINIDMPVILQNGDIEALIGESQGVTGSVLNDRLTDFLIELNRVAAAAREMPQEKVREAFSDYLTHVIGKNSDNVLGAYIYRTYGDRIAPEKYVQLQARYGQGLEALLK